MRVRDCLLQSFKSQGKVAKPFNSPGIPLIHEALLHVSLLHERRDIGKRRSKLSQWKKLRSSDTGIQFSDQSHIDVMATHRMRSLEAASSCTLTSSSAAFAV